MTTVATSNLGDGPDHQKVLLLDRLVDQGADVIGLQEAGDRRNMLARWCTSTDWRIYFGHIPGSASVPILWNPKTVKGINPATVPATRATNAGPLGAGPSVVKPKVWNRVRIDGDGEPFLFVNGHLPASLWSPRRRAIAKDQVDVLRKIIAHRRGAVGAIAVMDGNCEDKDRLWKPIKHLGMRQHTNAPTHGRRTIDLVWASHRVRGQAKVINVPSDHNAVLFEIREK